MTSTDAAAEARETVYAAIELSKKTWVPGIASPDRDRVRAFIASLAATLQRCLQLGNPEISAHVFDAAIFGF